MRCPECASDILVTDENGYKVCSECGLVIENECRLEASFSLSLNNTPIAPTSLLGTDIAPGHCNNLELSNKLRRCQKYLQQPYTRDRDALFQLKKLKQTLEVGIPDTTLIDWYKRIRKNYENRTHISAKNMASVIFYVVTKEYKINFNFSKFLEAAELTKSRFWQVFQALNLKHHLAKNLYAKESLEHYNGAELTKIQQELSLSPKIVEYAREVLTQHRFSSLSRINVGAALLAAQHHFKRLGELRFKELPVSKIWKALKVAPSTIYSKVNDLMQEKLAKKERLRTTPRTNPISASITALIASPLSLNNTLSIKPRIRTLSPKYGHLYDWLKQFRESPPANQINRKITSQIFAPTQKDGGLTSLHNPLPFALTKRRKPDPFKDLSISAPFSFQGGGNLSSQRALESRILRGG